MSKIVVTSALLAAGAYVITCAFGLTPAREDVRREMRQHAEAAWDALHTGQPPPASEVTFDKTVPLLPGIVWLAADLTVDGTGSCVSSSSLVVWYGIGSRVVWRSWDRS